MGSEMNIIYSTLETGTVGPDLGKHPTVYGQVSGHDRMTILKRVKCTKTGLLWVKYCPQCPCKSGFSLATQDRFN